MSENQKNQDQATAQAVDLQTLVSKTYCGWENRHLIDEDEEDEYYEQFVYTCIACGHETIHNPCHHCGTENPDND